MCIVYVECLVASGDQSASSIDILPSSGSNDDAVFGVLDTHEWFGALLSPPRQFGWLYVCDRSDVLYSGRVRREHIHGSGGVCHVCVVCIVLWVLVKVPVITKKWACLWQKASLCPLFGRFFS